MTNERPTLSSEERSSLLGAERPLRAAREVIEELEELGVDMTAERIQVEAQENLRAGLLERFSAKRARRRKSE